jgi:hypothetical protein
MKYLIAYKFAEPEHDSLDSIPNAIYNIDPDAVCVFDNVWLLVSELPFSQLHPKIGPLFSDQDTMIITEFTGGISGPDGLAIIELLNRVEV